MTPDDVRARLCELGDHLRAAVLAGRERGAGSDENGGGGGGDGANAWHDVAGATSADTIYRIDTVADAAVLGWFEHHWPDDEPVLLVTEGLEEPVVIGRAGMAPVWTCILDPIDGTRGLMYDKRPAWVLAAVAPHGGRLGDVVAAAMTELPTTKQWASDQISGIRGAGLDGLVGERLDVRTGERWLHRVQPSRADDLRHGWASFSRFFPVAKPMLAAVEDDLWRELYGGQSRDDDGALAELAIFDDQYLATGGQFHELIAGHDRMLGDLRPLAYAALGIESPIACHPYDCGTALVVQEAGCVLTDPWGVPLDVPLDTTTPVAWVGFANPRLAAVVRPALDRVLERHFGRAPGRSGVSG